jgi:hypothetical protein
MYIHLSKAHAIYKRWCQKYERKPVSNQKFKLLMSQMGYPSSLRNGYDSINGIIEGSIELVSAYDFLD